MISRQAQRKQYQFKTGAEEAVSIQHCPKKAPAPRALQYGPLELRPLGPPAGLRALAQSSLAQGLRMVWLHTDHLRCTPYSTITSTQQTNDAFVASSQGIRDIVTCNQLQCERAARGSSRGIVTCRGIARGIVPKKVGFGTACAECLRGRNQTRAVDN